MRPHIEMRAINLDLGWEILMPGLTGLEVKVLADDLDERVSIGARTRLVRFAPGVQTVGTLLHPYWEEVFILSGDLYCIDLPSVVNQAPMYSLRPPGTKHGPFGSRSGCTLFEIQYFEQIRERSSNA